MYEKGFIKKVSSFQLQSKNLLSQTGIESHSRERERLLLGQVLVRGGEGGDFRRVGLPVSTEESRSGVRSSQRATKHGDYFGC